jgi:hypothetical protein
MSGSFIVTSRFAASPRVPASGTSPSVGTRPQKATGAAHKSPRHAALIWVNTAKSRWLLNIECLD